ncbi:MAG TPA: HEAT repeat domain-containing protein, partial [Gemmataceae bacterium]|nr:HEAT repeat domain-containing protein [Gemmataceae bacterium]
MSAIHSLVLGLGIVWPGVQPEKLSRLDPALLRVMLLDHQQPALQNQAALSLLQNPTTEAERVVRQGLRAHEVPDVFAALADAVRACRDCRFVEELTAALANGSPSVRRAAQETLAALSGPDLIRRLRKIAENSRAELPERQAAIVALGRCGRRLAVAALLDLLASDQDALRQTAAAALGNLSGQTHGLDQENWRRWWQQHADQNEEDWLEERLAYEAARSSRLEGDLDRARTQVVRLHQQLWARLPAAERLNHAQEASESEDARVRELAVTWAGESLPTADEPNRRALADILLHSSRDGAVEVQRSAVLALGRVADLRARERLAVLLREAAAPVRAAAARALAQQARGEEPEAAAVRKQVVPLLREALRDPALAVVVEAAEDLGALGEAEGSAV